MVHGDSQLVIKFLNRLNVPKKPVFVMLVAEIRALLATLPVSVKFVHVARAQNELADYMGRLAEQQGHDVGLEDLEHAVID